ECAALFTGQEVRHLADVRLESGETILRYGMRERALGIRNGELHSGSGRHGEKRLLLGPGFLERAHKFPRRGLRRLRLAPQRKKGIPLALVAKCDGYPLGGGDADQADSSPILPGKGSDIELRAAA